MPRSKRLAGRRLQRIRRLKALESPLCPVCEAKGIVRPWTQLDHTIPLEKGGSNQWSNLVGLCTDCHADKTARDRGYKQAPCDPNGMPLGPHHWN